MVDRSKAAEMKISSEAPFLHSYLSSESDGLLLLSPPSSAIHLEMASSERLICNKEFLLKKFQEGCAVDLSAHLERGVHLKDIRTSCT